VALLATVCVAMAMALEAVATLMMATHAEAAHVALEWR
jgi:hypothetical protein